MLASHVRKLGLAAVLVAAQGAALAEQVWQGQLTGGGRVEVDPATNKPTYYSGNGAAAPLWDGVHQLEDGSTVIVRQGVMVPNEEVLGLRKAPPPERAAAVDAASLCEQLVRKVCGFGDECAAGDACGNARQLLRFAEEEREELSSPGGAVRFRETPWQCREALLKESYFKPCNKGMIGGQLTPCGELRNKVCGAGGECEGAPACEAADQLVDRELTERLESADPTVSPPTTQQCVTALGDVEHFAACGR